MTGCPSGSEQHARRVRHVACYSAKADCGGLLKMLAVKVEVTSASHRKAVVAKQRFDGDRRSLPNPKPSFMFIQSGRSKLAYLLPHFATTLDLAIFIACLYFSLRAFTSSSVSPINTSG